MMKKFKYPVESFLKLLKFNRDSAIREVKQAENKRNKLLEKYSYMENQMKEAYTMSSDIGKNSIDVSYVQANNHFIEMLKLRMEDVSMQISAAEQEYQNQYQSLLNLQMRVKKLERHKEIELEKYKKKLQKKVQKMTDEINSARMRGKDAKSL